MFYEKKLSIIIPVFNDFENLKRNLSSIRSSFLSSNFNRIDMEVIIVDDGSNCSYRSLIEGFISDFDVTLLHQENSRQGKARNNGLNVASGKYIWFIDSDDLILERSLSIIYDVLDLNHDILFFDAYVYGQKSNNISVTQQKEALLFAFAANDFIVAPWNKLFRREFLKEKKITFPEFLKYEDLYFSFITLYYSNSYKIFDLPIYKYNYNALSTTKKHDKSLLDIFKVLEKIESEVGVEISKSTLQELRYVHGIKYTLVRLFESRSLKLIRLVIKDNNFKVCLKMAKSSKKRGVSEKVFFYVIKFLWGSI